jgi:alkylhydroperoxidase/carboxymuconolactone decarboxylase family protein YurZ
MHASPDITLSTQRPCSETTLQRITKPRRRIRRLFQEQFIDRWGRPHLTIRERALCTIATDVLNGTLDESFRLHVDLALRDGAGMAQIRAVLLLVAEFGIAKAWQAYRALSEFA